MKKKIVLSVEIEVDGKETRDRAEYVQNLVNTISQFRITGLCGSVRVKKVSAVVEVPYENKGNVVSANPVHYDMMEVQRLHQVKA